MVDLKEPAAPTAEGEKAKRRTRTDQDVRALIPPVGLKEYWYPALEDSKVKNKPVGLKMLGEDLVFFRGSEGEVKCLWNVCPHRGGSLMHGDCHFTGTISCPYHGWTFDGDGNVLAVLPEGPDSKVPGKVTARKYPTQTLKGLVFVWMGEGEPAPIEEDVPPEFFDKDSKILYFTEMWHVNWNVALENGGDAHVPYLHRDSWRNYLVPSSPFVNPQGSRQKIVPGKAVVSGTYTGRQSVRRGSARRIGKPWSRKFFPLLNGYWPKHTYRNWWNWISKPGGWWDPPVVYSNESMPEEWRGGHHLPGMYRGNRGNVFYTRSCIPVTEDSSRQIYYKAIKPNSWLGVLYERLHWRLWAKRSQANFSHQDMRAILHQRYDTSEHLSATDIHQVLWRRLILQARGMNAEEASRVETTEAEEFSYARLREAGNEQYQETVTSQS